MAELSRSYFVALGTALEQATDVGTVRAILAHALEFLRSGRLSFGSNTEAWQEKLRPFIDSLCPLNPDEEVQSRYLALYMPPWGIWPSSLLSIVACDWWSEFTTQDKEEFFYPFFMEPHVLTSVTALATYLSALGPSRSKSPRVQLVGADIGLEMLQKILTDESLGKLKEVPETVLGNAGNDEMCKLLIENFGRTLVTLPDMLAGAVAGAENRWSSLARGNVLETIAKTLLCEFHERCCGSGDGADCKRVPPKARDAGVRFVCGMFDKMVRRGHLAGVASVIRERSVIEKGGGGPEESFAVRVFLELGTKAKVFERIVNSMCWPKLWRDEEAIGGLSRFVGPDVVSICQSDGDEGKQSKEGKEICHILTVDCFVKNTFALPVIHWMIEILTSHGNKVLMEAARQLLITWSDEECVRVLGIPQQAYITTALVAALERLHENGVDVLENNDLTGMIMEGVSTRLGNPSETINCQAMRVATVIKRAKTGEDSLVSGIDNDYLRLRSEETWLGVELRLPETSDIDDSHPRVAVGSDETNHMGCEQGHGGVDVDSDDDSEYVSSDDDDLKPLDLSEGGDGMPMVGDRPATLRDMVAGLRNTKEPKHVVSALKNTPLLIESNPEELESMASDIGKALVYAPVPDWADEDENGSLEQGGRWGLPGMEKYRFSCMVSLLSVSPVVSGKAIIGEVYSTKLTIMDRIGIMDALGEAAKRLANGGEHISLEGPVGAGSNDHGPLGTPSSGENNASTSIGKSRIWGVRSLEKRKRGPQRVFRNRFIDVALPWAVALLEECDRVKHGVDLFGRDHMLLARLLVTLGTFAQCTSQTSVSAKMALVTLELISSPGIHKHPEPAIRKSALSAAFQVLSGLPPARVAAATLEDCRGDAGNRMLAERLEWLRGWTLGVASSDDDGTCRMLASGCVRLQEEVALKAMEFLGNSEGDLLGFSKGSTDYKITW